MTSLKEKRGKHGKFSCCNHESYDKLYILPNSKSGFGHKSVFEKIKQKYAVKIIDPKTLPDPEEKMALLIRRPERGELSELFIKRKFMVKNKKDFLNLLKKLISKNIILLIKGTVCYDIEYNHFFINSQTFLCDRDIPIMFRICGNYDKLNCLFKYRLNDAVTVFCEIRSHIYSFKEGYESWDYSLDYAEKNGKSPALTDFHVLINSSGNVKFMSNAEKPNILAREFYAKNLDEGVAILAGEMKNLGFNIRIAEKRRCK